jgi:hypothetical protein
VHYHLGLCFKDLGLAGEASECFRTAVTLDDGVTRACALSLLVHEGRQAVDWSRLDADTALLLQTLEQAEDHIAEQLSPFSLIPIASTPAQAVRGSGQW